MNYCHVNWDTFVPYNDSCLISQKDVEEISDRVAKKAADEIIRNLKVYVYFKKDKEKRG